MLKNLCTYVYVGPIFNAEITATSNPTIYQPLILQCNATIVRGITSTVDIIWTTGDTQVRRVNNVTASSNMDSISAYNDSFVIPSLNISDIGKVYQCEVMINSVSPTTAKTDYYPIPGTYIYVHSYININIFMCITYTYVFLLQYIFMIVATVRRFNHRNFDTAHFDN